MVPVRPSAALGRTFYLNDKSRVETVLGPTGHVGVASSGCKEGVVGTSEPVSGS